MDACARRRGRGRRGCPGRSVVAWRVAARQEEGDRKRKEGCFRSKESVTRSQPLPFHSPRTALPNGRRVCPEDKLVANTYCEIRPIRDQGVGAPRQQPF